MTLPETSILIQSLIFILFLVGVALRLKKNYFAHVMATLAAVALMLTFFAWWISVIAPTFEAYLPTVLNPPHHLITWLAHETLGITTLVLGTWLVILWRRNPTEFAQNSKKTWQTTTILWISTYLVGLLLHAVLNTNLL